MRTQQSANRQAEKGVGNMNNKNRKYIEGFPLKRFSLSAEETQQWKAEGLSAEEVIAKIREKVLETERLEQVYGDQDEGLDPREKRLSMLSRRKKSSF